MKPQNSRSKLNELLQQGYRLTYEAAQDELDLTSTRHIRRLIKELRADGVNIQAEREDGEKVFFVAPADRDVEIRTVSLTERQLLALTVAAEAARTKLRPTPLEQPLEMAVNTLLSELSSDLMTFRPDEERSHWHFGEAVSVDLDPGVFRVLNRGIDRHQSVRIDYHTASTGKFWEGRKIDPLVMAVRGDSWMVAAYCHEREALRDFSIPGIEHAELCDPSEEDAYFTVPEDFDQDLHYRDRFSALSGDEVFVVRLLVEADNIEYFRRKEYHPTQQIEDVREDGRAVVSYEIAGIEEISSFIRSWGPGVRVLEPPALVERIRTDLSDTAALYEDAQ